MDEYRRILGVSSIQPSFSPTVTDEGRNERYDFTPIAGPTFGSSLQRLGH